MFDVQHFETEGFAMESSVLSSEEISSLVTTIEQHTSFRSRRGGVRDVMDALPQLRAVANSANVRAIVNQLLGANAIVVRSTLFDKTGVANWKVPWHQDVTIAVKNRVNHTGYGPWSIKLGIQHVQPPTEVLERMITIRVHLDSCPASNGALRVMPGTHRLGRINQNDTERYVEEARTITCVAEAGDALIMRPLLLHASSVSLTPSHRRILHYDFATGELDTGMEWRMR